MRRRIFVYLCLFFLGLFAISSCASNDESYVPNDPNQQEETIDNVQERKIIYRVTASLRTNDLDETLSKIKSYLNSDEWVEQESVDYTYAQIVLRVKSDRLDVFLNEISSDGDFTKLNKTSTDVSLTYQNTTNKISSLDSERSRLVELMENASMTEILQINTRIAEIDLQLTTLTEEINELVSLIDYSVVTLNINQNRQDIIPFENRIADTFVGSINALFELFKLLLLVIVAIIPFAIVIVPTIFCVRYFMKKANKNRKNTIIKK